MPSRLSVLKHLRGRHCYYDHHKQFLNIVNTVLANTEKCPEAARKSAQNFLENLVHTNREDDMKRNCIESKESSMNSGCCSVNNSAENRTERENAQVGKATDTKNTCMFEDSQSGNITFKLNSVWWDDLSAYLYSFEKGKSLK